jgi:hypothetical protein
MLFSGNVTVTRGEYHDPDRGIAHHISHMADPDHSCRTNRDDPEILGLDREAGLSHALPTALQGRVTSKIYYRLTFLIRNM